MPLPLAQWESFYVITGSSGAALTGLMFVVVALVTERMPAAVTRTGPSVEMSAFSTPTVFHFGMVLFIASVMTMPHETRTSLAWLLGLSGVFGLGLELIVLLRMRRMQRYVAVAEDWIFNAILPFLAYAALLAAAIALASAPGAALYTVAGAVLLLLLVGIHNSWDVALYAVTYRRQAEEPDVHDDR